MSSAEQDDDGPFAVGAGGGSSVYHTDPECGRVRNQTDRLKPRSWHFIEWHEMTPCQYCAAAEADD